MKNFALRFVCAALCLLLLCGCASDLPDNGSTDLPDAPAEDTAKDTAEPEVPSEEGPSEPETAPGTALTAAELEEWTAYFNVWENNGLLRFPYSDPAGDPEQLAPYLVWLFYDIGESESTFTDEEIALLSETDLWLELDAFRLSREFMNRYLYQHFNIDAKNTEALFDLAWPGVYLLEYDAWYIAHGDCAYSPYTIKRGEAYPDGTVKLCYFNDFLSVAQEDGGEEYVDEEMIVTLAPREDGTWYIVSHEIDRSAWND